MIQTRVAVVSVDEHGIARVVADHTDPLTLADAQEVVDAVGKVAQLRGGGPGRSVPILIDARRAGPITREAREFFVGDRPTTGTAALAFLVGSPVTRAIGSFFLKVQRPRVPSSLFTSEAHAMVWLRGFAK
ncbi:MAG: hypothetical protein HY906_01900 [Deltaproteobacteria bacterium]|nr:hypothetical protein [Deltaproteobacteria bacterium]